ncbi:MAG: squalene--hopene cyclase [Deltaproteobacteria bacterium]|nr:squalene--hopene cyclase [Deltaproteobacteria bacterium]MBW2417862.1 squalene--hopene cyclase [Deltaproteobacteria bacterium]
MHARPTGDDHASVDPRVLAKGTLDRAIHCLREQQQAPGWWKGELETNVTMEAEDLLLRQFLGLRDEALIRNTAAWIRSKQRPDGAWDVFYGGPADLSATVEAYVALRLAGDLPDAEHMRRAASRVRELGGLERSRVFTRVWLALFGEWSWDDLPALPPEVILLPSWFPLNIYDFGCWARQTIVPLTVVAAHRPARKLGFTLKELRVGMPESERQPLSTWAGRFQLLDRALHFYEKRPLGALRRHALRLCAEWIVRRQESDGCWGGIQPPWVYSIMALHLLGYPMDHPAIRKALDGLDSFAIDKDGLRRVEACQSPVWDTCLAGVALREAGVPADDPGLLRAADWLLEQEVRVPGDWSVRRPDLAPGGWAFEFANVNYPDLDDTAEVVMALRGIRGGGDDEPARAQAIECTVQRALDWTFGMQCSDGGWAAFDVDNTRTLCGELPFCDFGEVIDPPSADVTAHVLEMLGREGLAADPRVVRGRDWLLREQEADGSWFGRWGANYIYGTGAAVPALIEVGVPSDAPSIRLAVRWLEERQNEDGGWGESLRSYEDSAWRGRGVSTASQSAWALLALLAAGERGAAVERGVAWLARTQRTDGSWDEPEFTGTGFPGDFYINYHLYRLIFPVMALGRYLRGNT